jgi:hypothetical protein
LQILLKDGVVQLAQLVEVRKCPNHQQDSALHRRDQSSELVLKPCSLVKETSGPPRVEIIGDAALLNWQPCHWICALPTWNHKVKPEDGLSRLGEISLLVKVADIPPDLNLWEAANPGQSNRQKVGPQVGNVGEQALMPITICPMTGLTWVPWTAMPNVDYHRKPNGNGLRAPYPVGPTNFVPVGAGRYASHPWAVVPSALGHWKGRQGDEQPSHRRKKGEASASDARAGGSTAGKLQDGKQSERSAPELVDDRLLTALRVAMPSETARAPPNSKAHSDESTRASDSDVDDAQKTDADDRLHLREESAVDATDRSEQKEAPVVSDALDVTPSREAVLIEDSEDRVVERKGKSDRAFAFSEDNANVDLVQSEGSDLTSQTSANKDGMEDVSNNSHDAKEWSLAPPGLLLALNLDAPRWCV